MKHENFRRNFESIEDLIYFAAGEGRKRNGDFKSNSNWYGLPSWEEAEVMAYKGWPDGVKRAHAMQVEAQRQMESWGLEGLEPVESYDVSGAYVDVGAYCEGEPECMVEYEEQMMPRQRVARIYVHIGFNCNVTVAEAMRRGVAIAAIVDLLEYQGMQCEVWGVEACIGYGMPNRADIEDTPWPNMHRHAVQIKAAGQLLPIDRIAFAIGHPAFFRVCSWSASNAICGEDIGHMREVEIPRDWIEPGDLYIPPIEGGQPQFKSDDKALEWVADHVTKFIEEITK